MIGDVGLASLLEEGVSLGTGWKPGGLLLDLLHPCGKPVLEGQLLLEPSPLEHGALISMREGRERRSAFASPMVAKVRTVTIH
jgi:hypothetical protein